MVVPEVFQGVAKDLSVGHIKIKKTVVSQTGTKENWSRPMKNTGDFVTIFLNKYCTYHKILGSLQK